VDTDELIERFSFFDDWEERYAYIIQMGGKLPPFPEEERTEANKVRGCVSQVWMISHLEADRIHIQGDSDAFIVKGLVAILLSLYSGRTASEIAALDIETVFGQLELGEHLTPNRRNGFFSMVQRIRAFGLVQSSQE
jgi:cysteine desulfuration protein SufE